jgi:heat shock protein HslJ
MVILSLSLLLLSACSAIGAATGSQPSLVGTAWVLAELDGRPALDEPQVTLYFNDGELGGDAGCNAYGGSYEVENGALRIDEVFSTLRMCLEEERMTQETDFLGALRRADSYRVAGERLEIVDEAGATILVLEAME